MSEGILHTNSTSAGYVVGDAGETQLADGQSIELFVDGQWLTGHIARTSSEDAEAEVEESSEESFPASDPPSWSAQPEQDQPTSSSYTFVADRDGQHYDLSEGLRVRSR